METYNKKEFIRFVYEKVKECYPYDSVYWITQAVIESMEDIVCGGDKLCFAGRFLMEPKFKAAQKTGNFDKTPCMIPAHYEPYFKPSKRFKERCTKENMERAKMEEKACTEE